MDNLLDIIYEMINFSFTPSLDYLVANINPDVFKFNNVFI